jgi:hypothetical protein
MQNPPTHQGPSGFLKLEESSLLVDFGKICLDGKVIGFLYENGLLVGQAQPLGSWEGLRAIEEMPGCAFSGIDRFGNPLELPGTDLGPTGLLTYNNLSFNVISGRISSQDHRLVGRLDDRGVVHVRHHKNPALFRPLDEFTQLSSVFQGINSDQEPMFLDFKRPLHLADKTYWENEVIRYFEQYDSLQQAQQRYVMESMLIWAKSGILQVVRKSEGTAGLGNVKHGASGVTSVRRGVVTLDRDEFETELKLFKQWGALASAKTRFGPYYEVRLNMVVAHEFGHQLHFCLSQATQDRIKQMYEKKRTQCDRVHALPPEIESHSELLQAHQIPNRVFISGYARSSEHEYWAEAVGAFSCVESRIQLLEIDTEIHNLLVDIVLKPEEVMRPVVQEVIGDLQASLKLAGEFPDDLLR